MTATDELRNELRALLDEVIPAGGTESDTRFSDAELNMMLKNARNIYAAASEGWIRKAAMFQKEAGKMQSYSIGQESYTFAKATEMMEYALKMADVYGKMAAKSMGSTILRFKPPEVL